MIIIKIITITIDNKYFIYLKQIEWKNKKINEKKNHVKISCILLRSNRYNFYSDRN